MLWNNLPRRVPDEARPVFRAEVWRVRSVCPVKGDLLVRRAGLDEDLVVVGIVEVPPDTRVRGRNLEAFEAGGSNTHVVKLGKDLAVQVTQLVAADEPVGGNRKG